MAGNHDRDSIHAIRGTDRPYRLRMAHLAGDVFVGAGAPIRDLQQRRPHLLLERRARIAQRQIEVAALAGEVFVELSFEYGEPAIGARYQRHAHPAPQRLQLGLEHAAVAEFEETHGVSGGADDERPDWRLDPTERNRIATFCVGGRTAEDPCKRRTKPALRFEPAVMCCFGHGTALFDAAKRVVQASRAAECLKRHAMVLVKIAAGAGGIDAHAAQLRSRDALGRCRLEPSHELLDPGRWFAIGIERAAAFAGPVTREHRRPRRWEELDVFGLRLACAAGRPAENARGLHGGEENAVVGNIARKKRAAHFPGSGLKLHE